MKLNKLASAISRGKWLIEPRTAMVDRQRAVRFLSGDFEGQEEIALDKPYALKSGGYFDFDDNEGFELAEAGSVAIIPICGTIMKYDYCGSPGTDTLASWVKSAIASPQIDAIVLLVNSGGGSVEGIGEFADLIKGSAKTILAFCDGLMASAAYWIGCSTKEIWASHQTVEFGSIGTAVCFIDDTKAMEEMGYKDIYINADTSPEKNQDVIKAIAGDYSDIKNNIINPTNAIFMAAVKANRGDRLKLTNIKIDGETYQEPLTGKVYLADGAIENGLIDGISTLDELVERAITLSKENTTTKTANIMAVDTENKEKQVKKSTSLLAKIQALFASEMDDDMTEKEKAKKAAEDEETKKAAETKDKEEAEKKEKDAKKASKIDAAIKAGKTKKSKSDDDFDDDKNYDPDDDGDDDPEDDDEVEVNGKTFNMKDPISAKAALTEMQAMAEKEIGDRDALLEEATATIAENVAEMQKTEAEIKKTIKSSFTLKSSNRANRVEVKKEGSELESLKPKEGSKAEQILAISKSKATAKAASFKK